MISLHGPMNRSRCRLLSLSAVFCVALGLTCLGGCSSSKMPDGDGDTAGTDKPATGQPATGTGQQQLPADEPGTAREVLQKMVNAYREASSYADAGRARLVAEVDNRKIDQPASFAITLQRPNKLRMEAHQLIVVSDGRELRASIPDFPGQVVAKPVPEKLTLRSIYADRILASSLAQAFAGISTRLTLLLDESPLEKLIPKGQEPELAEPGTIGNRAYHRVKVPRPDGTAVYWIDRQTYVLQRIDMPTGQLREMFAQGGTVKSISLVANFDGAQLGGTVAPAAFQFEVPPGAELVKFFLPPHPAQLLGKKVPEFKFVDLEGNMVTPESLAGKITVLDFWATWCRPCRDSLPNFEKVHQLHKDNPQVAFRAVSVDQPSTENQELLATLQELGVTVPVLRDAEQSLGRLFHSTGIPTTFILDAAGVVQDYEEGGNPELTTVLPEKLQKLLAGEDIYQGPLEVYQQQLQEYEQAMEAKADSDEPDATLTRDHLIPQAKVAEQTAPETFKLRPLWRCKELKAPGNILVVPSEDGQMRLLVVDLWKSVTEVGLDGTVIATHPLDIEQTEVVSTLRTAVGTDQRRYFAAVASAQQRFHLFDQQWKPVFSFPQDALENQHSGIADVQFGDLDGDGTIEAYVGYWGPVGVQAVSLDGQRQWSNRSVANVVRMAVTGAEVQGGPKLLCTNNRGSLATIDAQGQHGEDVTVPGRLLHWIVTADLDGDGGLEWCGLAAEEVGDNFAIGLTPAGEELWNYSMPKGVHTQPVEPVVVGKLAPGAGAHWLLAGADGSIHLVAADGKPLDKFNYGAVLHGLATAEVQGHPLLFVSSSNGLEAWQAE